MEGGAGRPLAPLEEQLMRLLMEGPMVRGAIARAMAMPRTTVYDGLRKLMIKGLVTSYPEHVEGAGRGRPRVWFAPVAKENEDEVDE